MTSFNNEKEPLTGADIPFIPTLSSTFPIEADIKNKPEEYAEFQKLPGYAFDPETVNRSKHTLDFTKPISKHGWSEKLVLITGGCNGIGRKTVVDLAQLGATVVVGDIAKDGEDVVAQMREESGSDKIHFHRCDVTDYDAQIALFEFAQTIGSVTSVVVNAGVSELHKFLPPFTTQPSDPSAPPTKPNLQTLDVNINGAVYTIQLALHYLRLPGVFNQDRSITILGSVSSFLHMPRAPLYSASKHAIKAIFTELILMPFDKAHPIRINFVAPYFVGTKILPPTVIILLAGRPLTKVETVAETIVRLVDDGSGAVDADGKRIGGVRGRAFACCPEGVVKEVEVMEWGVSEAFSKRVISLLNFAAHCAGKEKLEIAKEVAGYVWSLVWPAKS